MTYTPTKWVNGGKPAINAENLNKIEKALAQLSVPDITTTTSTTQPNSYAGREMVLEIGGVTEQGENPSPTSPQEIKKSKVKGIRTHNEQLFDANNAKYVESLAFSGNYFASTDNNSRVYYVSVNPSTAYTIKKELGTFFRVGTCEEIPSASGAVTNVNSDTSKNVVTITTGPNDRYIAFYPLLVSEFSTIGYDAVIEKIMLNYGTTSLPWKPYTSSEYTFSQPIDLYGKDGVQDVITPQNDKRKFAKRVFDGSEEWVKSSSYDNRYYVNNVEGSIQYGLGMCDQFTIVQENSTVLNSALFISDTYHRFTVNAEFATLDEWKAHLAEKPMTVVYELAEETTEALPIADQIGLNSLATYDGITYVEFIYDELEPTFKGKYGTSEVGGMTLESLLTARNNAL